MPYRLERRFGTFFPLRRASDRPIAIACLRLFTLPPRPPLPLLSVPRLRRCIALFTSLEAEREYLRAMSYLNAALTLLKKTNEVGTLFHIAAAPRHDYAPDAKHVLPGIKKRPRSLACEQHRGKGRKTNAASSARKWARLLG
jgi:hypothetical protein